MIRIPRHPELFLPDVVQENRTSDGEQPRKNRERNEKREAAAHERADGEHQRERSAQPEVKMSAPCVDDEGDCGHRHRCRLVGADRRWTSADHYRQRGEKDETTSARDCVDESGEESGREKKKLSHGRKVTVRPARG